MGTTFRHITARPVRRPGRRSSLVRARAIEVAEIFKPGAYHKAYAFSDMTSLKGALTTYIQTNGGLLFSDVNPRYVSKGGQRRFAPGQTASNATEH